MMTPLEYKLTFVPHVLNMAEQTAGEQFSSLQVKCLENEIVKVVNEKVSMAALNMPADEYVRAQEYLRGQLEILQYLLAKSTARRSNTIATSAE